MKTDTLCRLTVTLDDPGSAHETAETLLDTECVLSKIGSEQEQKKLLQKEPSGKETKQEALPRAQQPALVRHASRSTAALHAESVLHPG